MKELSNFELLNLIDKERRSGIYDPKTIAQHLRGELKDWSFEDIYTRVNLIINNEDELENNIV